MASNVEDSYFISTCICDKNGKCDKKPKSIKLWSMSRQDSFNRNTIMAS